MHFIGDIFIWSVRSRKESFCSLKKEPCVIKKNKKKKKKKNKKKNVFVGFDFTNTPIFLCRTYWKFRSLKKKKKLFEQFLGTISKIIFGVRTARVFELIGHLP